MCSSGIILLPHDPTWSQHFLAAKTHLTTLLTTASVPFLSIEHIGSTSIPDLLSKPIIDIDIVVASTAIALGPATSALKNAGYRFLGDSGIPDRYAFWQPGSGRGGVPMNGEMRRNTYVVVEGCLSLRNHRDLKRVLMGDAVLRKEYGDVKKGLVRDEWVETVEDYCAGKNGVVCKILGAAGWTREELDVVTKSNLYARGMLEGF